jgi:hypothetical protein
VSDDKLNTYKPCRLHCNGHSPDCKDCEIDVLRGLLREVASCEDRFMKKANCHVVRIPADLWAKIVPLRTPPIVVVSHE